MLSDLFQQKLQLSTGSLPQVCPGLCRGSGVGVGQSPPPKLNPASLSPLQLPLHPMPAPPDVPVTPNPGSAEQQPPPLLPGLVLPLPEVGPGVPSPSLSQCPLLWAVTPLPIVFSPGL